MLIPPPRGMAGWPSISARHLARLSPSGSTSAAVRALAIASAARAGGIWPASAGPDHAFFDGPVIGEPARVRIAVALDQPGAFGDLERKRG